jgi:CheY-like chemotaxis protein
MKNILVVDDEKDLRELIKEKLQRWGYSVITAADGNEALSILKSSTVNLILLDVAMPVMDGYQVCAKIRQEEKTKDTPVLFLTGKDLDPRSIEKHNAELGACGYLPKPSTLNELLDKIKETIG